jgi:uncharacterized protein YicC (UPF0701 family)
MTGYAVRTRETPSGTLTIEIKSVNSRFLDLQFRINDDLRALEPLLRESVMGRVQRGKVECRLSFGRAAASGNQQSLNQELLAGLAALQDQVRARFVNAAPLSVNELLRWPGVIADTEVAQDTLQAETAVAMASALDAFIESRQREGAALEAVLLARITELEVIVTRITPLVPQVVAQFQQKAVDRMREALGLALSGESTADAAGAGAPAAAPSAAPASPPEDMLDRIRQEVTLYGMRIDVAEELARLSAHLTETRHILKKGGQVGKRLDFMMQELNREANTVGSKAAIKELSDASMAMKLLIEQMREQVQNLE